MARALALELAPVRVNVVSPGWVDTPVWDQIAVPEAKSARLAELAAWRSGGQAALVSKGTGRERL